MQIYLACRLCRHKEPLFQAKQKTPKLGGLELTLELGPTHQQTLHTAEISTTPSQSTPPGVITATAHAQPLTGRQTKGSKTSKFRRRPIRGDQGFSLWRHGKDIESRDDAFRKGTVPMVITVASLIPTRQVFTQLTPHPKTSLDNHRANC